MEDIAPELLARIEQEFEKRFKSDSILADLAAKLEAGTATHTEAYEYAGRVGEILTDAYQHNIASSSLPDGKLWYNIANRVITPTMKNNYDIISKYVTDVQTSLNKAAGLGIKALPPDMDVDDKIKGIVDRVSSEESYDDVKWILQEPVKTFSRNVIDSSIRANVEFQGKAGLTPKIVRKTSGRCCKWCTALAGTYTYPDVPRDVYRRHDNCRCTVNYDPGNGKVKNIHSGKEGKRRYVQNEYGGYTKTKEDRIAHAKEMAEVKTGNNKIDMVKYKNSGDPLKLRINMFNKSDPLYYEAFSIDEELPYEDVCGHGNPKQFETWIGGKKVVMNAHDFAQYLKESGNFKGQDLRFVSCAVGQGNNSFAQQLSKELGITVKAPDDNAYYNPKDGVITIGSPFTNTGKWRIFKNGDEVL